MHSILMYKTKGYRTLATLLMMALAFLVSAWGEDRIIEDFEGPGYAGWRVEGEAFGMGPTSVADYQVLAVGEKPKGHGYASSKLSGEDRHLGTLTSEAFVIDRSWLSFLIGGGNYPETALQLLVDGEVVRSSSGHFARGPGDDRMDWKAWDVREFEGKTAHLRIVDNRNGWWGYVLVDQIRLTNQKPDYVEYVLRRQLLVNADYLHLPLCEREHRSGPNVEKLEFLDHEGKLLRYVHLKLAEDLQNPEYWYSMNVKAMKGQRIELRMRGIDPSALERLELGDDPRTPHNVYSGEYRPAFHYSPRVGWMNDINGIYWKDGYYHLFHQYNPVTAVKTIAYDMHWGHSVSRDLAHWETWPVALFPDENGQCWSGSAWLVDPALVGEEGHDEAEIPALFFTATSDPFTQNMAYSLDRGKTWKRSSANPLIKPVGVTDRDPKVFWHEKSQRYIMIVFSKGARNDENQYLVYRSRDLRDWELFESLPNWYECPDFFQIYSPKLKRKVWALYGSYKYENDKTDEPRELRSAYRLYDFDGERFTPLSPVRSAHEGPRFYGALTFVNEPNDRIVMMGWARGLEFPGEPFNQCASVPLELSLKQRGDSEVLCMQPVEELKSQRAEKLLYLENGDSTELNRALTKIRSETLLDVELRFKPSKTDGYSVRLNKAIEFRFDPKGSVQLYEDGREVASSAVHLDGEEMTARILIDRGIVESFWNEGEASFVTGLPLSAGEGVGIEIVGDARFESVSVYRMGNIWAKEILVGSVGTK